jgi:hypothetical protein
MFYILCLRRKNVFLRSLGELHAACFRLPKCLDALDVHAHL